MTDPTPTNPTPPQGLTDEQLRDVLWKCLCERKANESPFGAGSSSESDMQARMDDCRAAIAADRAQRSQTEKAIDQIHLVEAGIRFGYMAGHNDTVEACYGDPDSVAEDYAAETLSDALSSLPHRTAAHEANHFRDTTKMPLTPEEVEARFRAWWAESYPNAPAGTHAVQSHVAFALHLMGGEGAA